MVVDTYNIDDLRQNFTSGTTGTPLRLYENEATMQRTYAYWSRFRKWFGFEHWPPRATFGGRVVVPRHQDRPPFWRYNAIEHQWVFSPFHLSDDTAPDFIKKLERVKPFLLDGYVSSIYVLARYVNRMGITSIRPKAVQTTSETLLDAQRAEIEKAFQCKVYNQYSHGEKAVYICECPEGSLHINDEFGVVEIIKDGQPAQPGEIGEMVVTGFCNTVMPLIRYQTSDLALQTDDTPCACGRGLSRVGSVEGRVIDVLRMPDGKIVPPTALTLLFDKAYVIGIAEAQIHQVSRDLIIIRMVPLDPNIAIDQAVLETDLRSMMGSEINFKVEIVDHIPRTAAGKYKFVLSDIGDGG
jgi:phenylacetate-CoA ligase